MLSVMKFDGGRVLPLTEDDVKKGQLFMEIFSPIEDLFMRLNGDRECIINRVLPTLMEISGMETEFSSVVRLTYWQIYYQEWLIKYLFVVNNSIYNLQFLTWCDSSMVDNEDCLY